MLALVADDDVLSRTVLVHSLRKMGFVCHEAEDGAEAMRMFYEIHYSQSKYDCVVLDHQMPGRTGCQVARFIRSLEESVGILIVSATLPKNAAQEMAEIGVETMAKPVCWSDIEKFLSRTNTFAEVS